MEPDRLFIETVSDLQRRIEPGTAEYDLLTAAGLLRKLLLDSEPLVHRVNRDRRLKIRYRVNNRQPIWKLAGSPRPVMWSMEGGFDPDSVARSEPVEVSQDNLLDSVVMLFKSHEVTVRDLISHAANVRGGVHLGQPHTEKEKALSELASTLEIGGYPAATSVLQAIGRVALKGLAPLRAEIERG
jgi:hypothetical protein